jgi:hypothetical protein
MVRNAILAIGWFFSLSFCQAQTTETQDPRSLVIWKDVTIPERAEYENIVVMSGAVEFYGKTEKLVVIGGKIRLHDGAQIKSKMIVLGGTIEQLNGAKISGTISEGTAGYSVVNKLKKWIETWKNKWKHRIEDSDDNDEDDDEETSSETWSKIFVAPLILTLPLTILLVIFGMALLFTFVAPRISESADQIFRNEPISSLMWGSIGYLLMTPFIAFLTLSIIGIPLVPLFLLFILLFVLAGFFTASRSLGAIILRHVGVDFTALNLLLGLILLYGILFFPFIGKLLVFFILIAGTGAVLRSVFDARGHFKFRDHHQTRTFDV